MDQISKNYKKIINEAIATGVIPKDSQEFYLSALDGDNSINSDSSIDFHDAEDFGSINSELHEIGNELPPFSKMPGFESEVASLSDYEQREPYDDLLSIGDRQSEMTPESVENYSIFDLDKTLGNSKVAVSSSDFDSSSIMKNVCKESTKMRTSYPSCGVYNVKKYPKENETVDFKIPIYVDLKNKNVKFRLKSKNDLISLKEHSQCIKQPSSNEEANLMRRKAKSILTPVTHSSIKNPNSKKSNTYAMEFLHNSVETSVNFKEFNNECKDSYNKEAQEFCAQGRNIPTFESRRECPTIKNDYQNYKQATNVRTKEKLKMDEPLNSACIAHEENFSKLSHHFKNTAKENKRSLPKLKFGNRKNPESIRGQTLSNCKTFAVQKTQPPQKSGYCKCGLQKKSKKHTDTQTEARDDDNHEKHLKNIKCQEKTENDRLLNVNIICQFYSKEDTGDEQSNCSDGTKQTKANQKASDSDHVHKDLEETIISEEGAQRRTTCRYLSKIFSTVKQQAKGKKN
ncbi:uncharacterized protein LOC118192739 [Stegodyphus dumicola]|uniref:uncharacterized protein LOC118192739 n=1 Tax=Stegodyphus dumicola TaxID=202533 RepID=UPI0015A9ECAD|nr:uncharacterized protein LOC118192739 [Stegodyphus dumicola]